jgi:hypothetical protein
VRRDSADVVLDVRPPTERLDPTPLVSGAKRSLPTYMAVDFRKSAA